MAGSPAGIWGLYEVLERFGILKSSEGETEGHAYEDYGAMREPRINFLLVPRAQPGHWTRLFAVALRFVAGCSPVIAILNRGTPRLLARQTPSPQPFKTR